MRDLLSLAIGLVITGVGNPGWAAAPPQLHFPTGPPFHCVLRIPAAHKASAVGLAFSPDGAMILTTGDVDLSVWDAATGKRIASRRFTPEGACLAEFVSGGKEIAALPTVLKIHIMDARTLEDRKVLHPPERAGQFLSFAATPDGHTLLMDCDNSLGAWDVRTGKRLWLTKTPHPLSGLGPCTPDGVVVRLDADRPLRLFDAKTGKERLSLGIGSVRPPHHAAYHRPVYANGLLVGSVRSQSKLLMWREGDLVPTEVGWRGRWVNEVLSNTEEEAVVDGSAWSLAVSPDGKTVAVSCDDSATRLIETASGGVRAVWGQRVNIAFSPDGRRLATRDGRTGDLLVFDWLRPTEAALSLRPSPDRSRWWDTLADRDAAKAFRAMGEMASDPVAAMDLLAKRLPSAAAESKRAAVLVAILGDDDFETRKKAEKDLDAMGLTAEPVLLIAMVKASDLEMRRNLRRLLARLPMGPSEKLRQLRAVEVLVHLATPEAKRLLDHLANCDPRVPLTLDAQCGQRLVRAARTK